MKPLSSSPLMLALAGLAAVRAVPSYCAEPDTPGLPQHQQDSAVQSLLAQLESNLVTIPAGKFRMGDTAGTGEPDEKPAHDVSIGAFRMSKYEVTFSQYDAFARSMGKELPPDQGLGPGRTPGR
jgi:formylglycine-generating enzyme required for sulfatase activity